ncbi:MAG: DAD family-domain-containing protein [Olpidium bornovanus]|uniref:Dolichyl-diphosphooligosaccharide--protein glycosyltransferase subunit OST2 n=1 Tax=Olpidium bornovanus TaxID=278681 RepID=A0A8H8A1T0_9FUNG|nr:MAG: DAD family-domain-containing protein [Olpidium bornovanus]
MRTPASATQPPPSVQALIRKLRAAYDSDTPAKLKALDAYMAFVMFTGVLQFVYCTLVGSYPFNAFLGGFAEPQASFARDKLRNCGAGILVSDFRAAAGWQTVSGKMWWCCAVVRVLVALRKPTA